MNSIWRRLIPNGLSLARLFLGLAFPWLPADWRLPVIAVAAVTDFLDGLTARWLNCVSETGQVLDPVADKAFVLALAGTLIAEGTLGPLWALAVAARDLVVVGGLAIAWALGRWPKERRLKPTWLGKCTTAAQFALLAALLIFSGPGLLWLLALTAALSIAAAVDYARTFVGTLAF